MKESEQATRNNLILQLVSVAEQTDLSLIWLNPEDRFSRVKAHMDLEGTRPVFGVFDKVIFKPACSATETS